MLQNNISIVTFTCHYILAIISIIRDVRKEMFSTSKKRFIWDILFATFKDITMMSHLRHS